MWPKGTQLRAIHHHDSNTSSQHNWQLTRVMSSKSTYLDISPCHIRCMRYSQFCEGYPFYQTFAISINHILSILKTNRPLMLTLTRCSKALARPAAVRSASSVMTVTSSSSSPADRGNIQDLLAGNSTARNGVGTCF